MTDSHAPTPLDPTSPPVYDLGVSPGQGRSGPRPTRARRGSDLGRRLTTARQARGWTQAQLAAELGADLATVQRWEAGRVSPRGLYLRAVERFLAAE